MCVDNGQESLVEAGLHGGAGRLPVAQFLANALEYQDVGIDTHADGQNHAGNAGQSKHCTKKSQGRQKNDEVQDKREHRVSARKPVIDQHEDHNHEQAKDGSLHSVTDGIRAERRPHRALFEIFDGRRQRSRAQHQGQIVS